MCTMFALVRFHPSLIQCLKGQSHPLGCLHLLEILDFVCLNWSNQPLVQSLHPKVPQRVISKPSADLADLWISELSEQTLSDLGVWRPIHKDSVGTALKHAQANLCIDFFLQQIQPDHRIQNFHPVSSMRPEFNQQYLLGLSMNIRHIFRKICWMIFSKILLMCFSQSFSNTTSGPRVRVQRASPFQLHWNHERKKCKNDNKRTRNN